MYKKVKRLAQTRQRKNLFDNWAKTYDADLEGAETFPFIGYDTLLNDIIAYAEIEPDYEVLDLGIGTGNLARRVPVPDDQIWGVDFSAAMLAKARLVLPAAHLIQADLVGKDWLEEIDLQFDRILSAYTFHEFADAQKNKILIKLAQNCLKKGGLIVVGDISFQNENDLLSAWAQFVDSWDDDEYYWSAETAIKALNHSGFSVVYEQVSCCAGIYKLFWTGN
jgi:putative AdoMet-dependent methyltransferase